MKGLFNPKKKPELKPLRGHLFSIGKAPNYGKTITSKIKSIGRVHIPKGKMKIFKSFVRIPRGINIK